MEFKYHKAYRGFYLIENGKFKRPYKKLDQQLTERKLIADNKNVEFSKDSILNITDNYVVIVDKDKTEKTNLKLAHNKEVVLKNNLDNIVPNVLVNSLIDFIDYQEGARDIDTINSVFEIIENILYADGLFKTKAKKMFFYKNDYLLDLIRRYVPIKQINSDFKKEIIENYPSQYVYEHLPLDYKEKEMIYVFYFIMLIELLAILK